MIACGTPPGRVSSPTGFCSCVPKSSDDACNTSKIVPPWARMLLTAAIMLRVVSERGLQRTSRSKIDFAPGLLILRAVMMLKWVPCPCLVFGSRLVQNSCICTFKFLKNGGEMNFSIKTAFVDEIFLALIPMTCILPSRTL